jgi:hypothetical protein
MTRRMSDEDRVKLITVRRVAEAVTLVVNELPQGEGAPARALYAGIVALLSIGEFETTMRGLVFAGRVRREGDLYYPGSRPPQQVGFAGGDPVFRRRRAAAKSGHASS